MATKLSFLLFTSLLLAIAAAEAIVDTNVPLISWQTRLDLGGVWAYHVIVSNEASCSDPADVVWDTGNVWQENEPFPGACHYTGPPLSPAHSYYWCAWETQLTSASGKADGRSCKKINTAEA